ncbi:MAG: aquaporin [Planctomycetes bacterium]|nr:aquaporin [Planctomycetota bacterium]
MNGLLGPCVAEAVGTFYLCFIGAGAICMNQQMGPQGYGLLGIALAHGVALAIGVSTTMAISGGQLNPAVSVGLCLTRKIPAGKMAAFILSQLAGAVIAAVLLQMIFPEAVWKAVALGTPGLGKEVHPGTGLVVEIILTFLLLFSVFGTAVDPRAPKIGGFGIGLTVFIDILVGGPITGAAMNPARHFGSAVASGTYADFWIYWAGPIIGGCLGALVYDRFILPKNDRKG